MSKLEAFTPEPTTLQNGSSGCRTGATNYFAVAGLGWPRRSKADARTTGLHRGASDPEGAGEQS
jgi:hypothetical protein